MKRIYIDKLEVGEVYLLYTKEERRTGHLIFHVSAPIYDSEGDSGCYMPVNCYVDYASILSDNGDYEYYVLDPDDWNDDLTFTSSEATIDCEDCCLFKLTAVEVMMHTLNHL